MHYVYGWLVGVFMGAPAAWIWKSHLVHEAEKLRQAAQKAIGK